MSAPSAPLTVENIFEMFRETDRKFQETAEQIKRTHRDIAGLTSSVGALVESMVQGNIVEKFEALGYNDLDDCC